MVGWESLVLGLEGRELIRFVWAGGDLFGGEVEGLFRGRGLGGVLASGVSIVQCALLRYISRLVFAADTHSRCTLHS